KLIHLYIKLFKCTTKTFVLKPISSKGTWDGKLCFENLPQIENNISGKIAVLTRATIRLRKAKQFWRNVPLVNHQIKNTKGLVASYGIGEVPFLKQATLSIWENIDAMKTFAYKMKEHKDVITKTRKEDWYSEEMFARFEVIDEFEHK
ncbi:MAG: spheroidene monooxygenase, partial [Bacteroidetes bacterium]|nr:spheroidene monooxygenase [Bacteroidota bacterium]